ncbi:MAG: FtsX-like permease family protein [Bacteroidota bacterium]
MNRNRPPGFFIQLFKWYCKESLTESILGDLEEQFEEDLQHHRVFTAKRRFVWNVIRFFRKGIIKPIYDAQKLNTYGMLKHDIKLALRGFKRFKTSFAINLIGLSSGLACTLLIYLWVKDEWKKDKFHENEDRLYQVMHNIEVTNKIETIKPTPALLGQALLDEFPAVEKMVSVVPAGSYGANGIVQHEEKQLKALEQYATAGYFDVFSFPLKIGNKKDVLTSKDNVVISEELSKKLVGEGIDPRGKSIIWHKDGKTHTYVVTGVFAALPANTSEKFDLIFTLDTFLDQHPHIRDWKNSDPSTFLLLSKNTEVSQFNTQIKKFMHAKQAGIKSTLFLQKYSDTYLFGKYENGVPLAGRMRYVKLFSVIAALVLFIACINFMNLSTARASRRLKEIGVKKAMGVNRRSLVFQFFTETFLLSLLSVSVAFILVIIFLGPFNELTGKEILLRLNQELVLFSLTIMSITTLLAGGYPALYLSGFEPIAILKGKLAASSIGDLWARKGLVIVQYCASAILITSVWVVASQIKFIQNKNLGFEKEEVIYFNADGRLGEQSEIFIEDVRKLPGIMNAGAFGHDLLGGMGKTTGLNWEGKNPEVNVRFGNLEVGYGLIETFGMEIAMGRPFSREFGDNNSEIVLNEKAIEIIGIEDPIGKSIQLWGRNREIIGVVKNFHFESLHEEIKPCFFQIGEDLSSIVVRIAPGSDFKTIERIEKLYRQYNPALTFNFQFFEQEYYALYKSEQQIASLSTYFAGIAIIISCLGLFGLVAFTAERKQKEIGIRKVLGASVLKLIFLLSNDFIKTVLAAIIISLPISYWLVKLWLEAFVYRIELSIWFFAGSGFIVLLIALITMGAQTVKSATIKPVNSLKDE